MGGQFGDRQHLRRHTRYSRSHPGQSDYRPPSLRLKHNRSMYFKFTNHPSLKTREVSDRFYNNPSNSHNIQEPDRPPFSHTSGTMQNWVHLLRSATTRETIQPSKRSRSAMKEKSLMKR